MCLLYEIIYYLHFVSVYSFLILINRNTYFSAPLSDCLPTYLSVYLCIYLSSFETRNDLIRNIKTIMTLVVIFISFTGKYLYTGKVILVTGRGGPQGCQTSSLPHFPGNRLTDGGKVFSLTRRPPFTHRKVPGTHFC
jgi:hypothetical protein